MIRERELRWWKYNQANQYNDKGELKTISVVQTTKQKACAIGYLQGITFKVENLERLKILEKKYHFFKEK